MKKTVKTPMGCISIMDEKKEEKINDMFRNVYEIADLNEKNITSFEAETKIRVITPFGCVYLKTKEAADCERVIVNKVFSDMPRSPFFIVDVK